MRSSVPESRRALKEKPHALRALLLALDTGPRRIRAARAGGSGSRLHRCRASAAARRSDVDALPGRQVAGAPALRAAVPQGGKARDRADGEHPPLARPAPRPGAEKRGVPALGAPAPAHDGRLAGLSARCASPDRGRLLLRGPEARIEAPRRALHRRAPAEIPRLLRAGASARERRMASRQGVFLCGPVAFPDDRGPALCFSPRDGEAGAEIPEVGRAARARHGAAAHRGLPRVQGARRLQPARYLQALSRTRRPDARKMTMRHTLTGTILLLACVSVSLMAALMQARGVSMNHSALRVLTRSFQVTVGLAIQSLLLSQDSTPGR